LAEASELGRELANRMKAREKRKQAQKIAQEAAIAAMNDSVQPPVKADEAISST